MKPWELHPAIVHFPIALLLCAVVLEFYAWFRKRPELGGVVSGLFAAGVVSGIVAALAGALAYFTVPAHTELAHKQMYWHLSLEVVMVVLFGITVLLRWREWNLAPPFSARVTSWVAAGVLLYASSLGGELVYRGAAGVDPTLLAPAIVEGHSHSHGTSDEHSHGDSHETHSEHAHEGANDKAMTHPHEEFNVAPTNNPHDTSVEKQAEEHPTPIKQP